MEPSYGQGVTPLYKLWRGIITRCTNPNSPSYKRYGQRGILIFEPWRTSFLTFKSYIENTLGERPPGNVLDRINNNGNYEPGNIRWSNKIESANNTSTNYYLTYKGQTRTLIQWAREFKINRATLKNRLMCGWGIEEALIKPVEKYRKGTKPRIYSINGEVRSLREWAQLYNIPFSRVHTRIYRLGWDFIKALTTKPEDQTPITITINKQTKTLTEWAAASGVAVPTLKKRIERGILGQNLINKNRSVAKYKKPYRKDALLITYKNETKSLREFSDKYKINYVTLRTRIMILHWPIEKALRQKTRNHTQANYQRIFN